MGKRKKQAKKNHNKLKFRALKEKTIDEVLKFQ